jgi:amino acid adenylation domain-containing protein
VSLGEGLAVRRGVLDEIIEWSLTTPDHPAARDLDRQLTYAQLVDEVARVGAGLLSRGVSQRDRVALLISNSVDFLVAALASLWIGAVFVPLAVTDPLPRVRSVVADSNPAIIVTASPNDGELSMENENVTSVVLDDLRGHERAPDYSRDSSRIDYMIYTSGTTGKPKGVEISDGAFSAAVHSTGDALGLDQSTRTLLVSPIHFDGSYANLFPTLIAGGTVVMRPRESLLYPRTFFTTVAKELITYSGFTPSYLRLLLASRQMLTLGESSLKTIALGGEAISRADLESLWSKVPALRVFNRYGPTETTIAVTNVELTPEMIEGGVITIGRPHAGVSFTLVDERGSIIDSANQVGELYIGGDQLMDGYWGDPDLSAKVLRRDVVPDETVYRTGDLVYRADDKNYVYVDRTDRVVKRSGVRISLLELSSSIGKLERVNAASCMTFDRDGELGIVAFIVADEGVSVLDVRRATMAVLPANMLPDRIELISAMPLNRSNALDEAGMLSAAGLRPFRPAATMTTDNH